MLRERDSLSCARGVNFIVCTNVVAGLCFDWLRVYFIEVSCLVCLCDIISEAANVYERTTNE